MNTKTWTVRVEGETHQIEIPENQEPMVVGSKVGVIEKDAPPEARKLLKFELAFDNKLEELTEEGVPERYAAKEARQWAESVVPGV